MRFVGRRILAVRSALLGPGATPLPVIGPRPLRRVLAAVSQLEPMAFRYIDTFNTLPLPPDQAPDEVLFCSHACKRPLGSYRGPVWGVGDSWKQIYAIYVLAGLLAQSIGCMPASFYM